MSGVDPWTQYCHLANLLESIPTERQLAPALALVSAAHVIFRHLNGQRTDAEAHAALGDARRLIGAGLAAAEARGAA